MCGKCEDNFWEKTSERIGNSMEKLENRNQNRTFLRSLGLNGYIWRLLGRLPLSAKGHSRAMLRAIDVHHLQGHRSRWDGSNSAGHLAICWVSMSLWVSHGYHRWINWIQFDQLMILMYKNL
jgi:hypothetical protein